MSLFSIYLMFYLIPKIYFKQYGWGRGGGGVVVQIIFFSLFVFHNVYKNNVNNNNIYLLNTQYKQQDVEKQKLLNS